MGTSDLQQNRRPPAWCSFGQRGPARDAPWRVGVGAEVPHPTTPGIPGGGDGHAPHLLALPQSPPNPGSGPHQLHPPPPGPGSHVHLPAGKGEPRACPTGFSDSESVSDSARRGLPRLSVMLAFGPR